MFYLALIPFKNMILSLLSLAMGKHYGKTWYFPSINPPLNKETFECKRTVFSLKTNLVSHPDPGRGDTLRDKRKKAES